MKLDRNANPDRSGKYALIKIRRLNQIMEAAAHLNVENDATALAKRVHEALCTLKQAGLIHFGNEGNGEQFFVMKHKDRLATPALFAYAEAIGKHARELGQLIACQSVTDTAASDCTANSRGKRDQLIEHYRSLMEYWTEMHCEAMNASACKSRIPD